MRRRGFTIHETLISLVMMVGVMGLAAHAALGQLRFFRGTGEIVALRGQIGQATTVVARTIWGVSPSADIVVALDSAIELHATIGTAVGCGGRPGLLTVPEPRTARGNALSAFLESPEAGDRVHVFFSDSLGATWLTLRVASSPVTGHGDCAELPAVADTWSIELREQISVPARAVLRFTRPVRLSVYRAADNRWYLGGKDWNGTTEQFNVVQPIAGPLRSYSADPARTGLHFLYRDENGVTLPIPADPMRVATITVTARGETGRPVRVSGLATQPGGSYADSNSITVALRNWR